MVANDDQGFGIDCKNTRCLLLTVTQDIHVTMYNSKNMRTFLVGNSNIVVSNLLNLTCVRELCLKCCSIKELPNKVGNLIHLRYLNLSHSTLEELPETICNLCKLQTLDVRACHKFKKLPGIG